MNRKERRRQRRVEMTERIAYQLYQRRLKRGYEGSSEKDWQAAEKIARNPIVCSSFQLNQWFKNRWRRSIGWYESTSVEHALETLTEDLKNLAVFDLLALLANLAIIISLGSFLTNGERQRHDQQVYEAWQVITNAHGQSGNGGRRRALEFLNSTPGTPGRRRWFGILWPKESLQGVDISKASLAGIELPEAYLGSANLQAAVLGAVNLQAAFLWEANLQDTYLKVANLQAAFLGEANLQSVDLGHANLQEAFLEKVNLRDAYLGAANLQGALLLATDLRTSKGLTKQQLTAAKICHVAFPDYIKGIDSGRDCEVMPQALVNYFEQRSQENPDRFGPPLKLERANEIVEEARQTEWDVLEKEYAQD